MRIILIFFIFVCVSVLGGCKLDSYLVVYKHRDYKQIRKTINKIVFLDPEYDVYLKSSDGINYQPATSNEKKAYFKERITALAKSCKIEAVVENSLNINENDVDFFNDILNLKKSIYIANASQDLTKNYKVKSGTFATWFKPPRVYYKYAPTFPADYAHLSKKFGTPYVAYTRILTLNNKKKASLYYIIVGNIETGRIIYREVRALAGKMTSIRFESIVYDSFKIIKKK